MVKYLFFILGISLINFGMEDTNKKMVLSYAKDILPCMPAYTKITPERGAAVLEQLIQESFDIEDPRWKFEHTFDWVRECGGRYPNDLAILKRFIALHIDRSEMAQLSTIKESIIKDPESLRWVVVSDFGCAVSDESINKRWQQFISRLILCAPIAELIM